MAYFGRTQIFTDVTSIDENNILQVLNEALSVHDKNKSEIEVLYQAYLGNQDVLDREKDIRPEINNKIVENHAKEIVDFKCGYLMGEPVQYISRFDGDESSDSINKLNAFAISESMSSKNYSVVEWNHICGTAYKMALPDPKGVSEDEAPFEVFVPDPRCAFVVYLNDLSKRPMMSVTFVKTKSGDTIYSCYTADSYFEIKYPETVDKDHKPAISKVDNVLGIPMVEYPMNNFRQGAFECVMGILDAINSTQSDRLDGVDQFIQALLLFHNVKIEPEEFEELRREGGLNVQDADPTLPGEVKYLVQELNQTQTQTLKDDLYEQVLLICGMPNRNGGSSTSDTGAAVTMRDGWSAANVRAAASEDMFKQSEREFLKIILRICGDMGALAMKVSSIKIQFTRRNYENIMEKATVLTTMLGSEKIAPQLAFSHCGMFADPEMAFKMSMEYYDEQKKEAAKNEQNGIGTDTGGGEGDNGNPEPGTQRGDRSEEG